MLWTTEIMRSMDFKKITLRNNNLDLLIEEAKKYTGHPTYCDSEWIVNRPISVGLFGVFKIILRKKNQEELNRDIERKKLQKKVAQSWLKK